MGHKTNEKSSSPDEPKSENVPGLDDDDVDALKELSQKMRGFQVAALNQQINASEERAAAEKPKKR